MTPRCTHLSGDPASDFARFMALVSVAMPHDCWEWQGNRPGGLYGHFSVGGATIKAHRWLYAAVVGAIPEGLVLRHKCDNPGCVNPLHLEPGTNKDNVADRVARGRSADRQGEKHPLRKLSDEDVRAIRRRVSCGESRSSVARDYPIGRQQIDKIVTGRNWGHVHD